MKKYRIHQMGNAPSILVDSDELQGIVDKLPTGQFIKVRQGICNPSMFVCLVEDVNETTACTTKEIESTGKIAACYKKCEDIFKDIDFDEDNRHLRLANMQIKEKKDVKKPLELL